MLIIKFDMLKVTKMILTLKVLVISMVATVTGAPGQPIPNKIQLNCTTFKDNVETFKIFNNCVVYLSKTKVDDLSVGNQRKIMCPLYVKSLQDYCLVNNSITDNDLFGLKDEKVKICEELSKSLEKTQWGVNFTNIFKEAETCGNLCVDYDGTIKNICSAALYSINHVLKNKNTQKFEPSVMGNSPVKPLDDPNQKQEVIPGESDNADRADKKRKPKVDSQKAGSNAAEADPSNIDNLSKQKSAGDTNKPQTADDQNQPGAVDAGSIEKPVDPNQTGSLENVNDEAKTNGNEEPIADEKKTLENGKLGSQIDEPNAAKEKSPVNKDVLSNVDSGGPQKKTDEVKKEPDSPGKPEKSPVSLKDRNQGEANEDSANKKEGNQIDDETKPEDNPEEKPEDYIDDKNVNIDETIDVVPQSNKVINEDLKYSDDEKITDDSVNSFPMEMDDDSYFFSYFMVICIIFVLGYVVYHNKQRILALVVEGRQGKRQYRGRRPNSASYHKLDSNLEEAISSTCSKNTTNIIY